MKYSARLSDAIHLLIFILLNPKENLSSSAIAESIKTNPAYIRKLMSSLQKANLIQSKQGIANPILTRDLSEITFLDIYQAVEGDTPFLHLDTHTNPFCGVGVNIQSSIGELYTDIQGTLNQKLKQITLKDVLDIYIQKNIY